MKKEIIVVDETKKVYRVTTPDERWYLTEETNKETGLPEIIYKPSITWITSFYPKGIAFYKWLANKGWDEAEALKTAAGDKGSKVHKAIEDLIAGGEIKMEDKYLNKTTGESEELSVDEYEALMSFVAWANEAQPQFLLQEKVIESKEYNYAGTVDCVARIADSLFIIDFKTGQNIWPEYELQLSAYKRALLEMYKDSKSLTNNIKLAVLQLGYKRNKKLYKFTEVEDKFMLFLSAQEIWRNETEGQAPKQREYPLTLKLKIYEKETTNEEKEIKRGRPKKAESVSSPDNKGTK